jgi:alpha-N-arabinofuranosidase
VLTPTYDVFDLYSVHQNARWLPLKIASPNYICNYQSIPALNASASIDSNGVAHISLVNLDPEHEVPVSIHTDSLRYSHVSGRILASEKFTDINTFRDPHHVVIRPFEGATRNGNVLMVHLWL